MITLYSYQFPKGTKNIHFQLRRFSGSLQLACQLVQLAVGEHGQIKHAYGVDQLPYTGAGETIAIVDAYGSPS